MLKKTLLALSLAAFAFLAATAAADAATGVQQLQTNLGSFGTNTGLGNDADLKTKIASIVNIVLGFVGLISTIVIIYAGFRWMTASGNEEQIKEARGNIRNAVIGIVVVLLSFTIINFAVSEVSDVTGAGEGDDGGRRTRTGTGACIYTPDDNAHGDSGDCADRTECQGEITYGACKNLRGRRFRANRPDADCEPWDFYTNETCADHGF